jgi:hypothetical protein
MVQAEQFKKAMNTAFLGTRNPMWDDDVELSLSAMVNPSSEGAFERALSFAPFPVNSTTSINPRFAKRHPVADLNIPRDPVAVLQVAYRYCYENPFVAKALSVKTNFLCKDFHHETHNEKVQDFYDDMAIDLRLRTVLPKIGWNLFGVGVCPIWWGGEDGGQIQFIKILDPRTCHITHVFGKPKLFLKIDAAMVDAVRDPKGIKSIHNRVLYDSMPKYWIDQIADHISKGCAGQGLIELAEGSYTVVENSYSPMSRSVGSLDGIPLQPAFDALQRYKLLAAGDFAIAWNVKNMITLISEGDPKMEGKDYKPMDDTRMSRLQGQFGAQDQSLQVVCDPTTNIRYIVPPLEAFNPIKYSQVEKEIKEILNLPSFMWQNDGQGTYGAAMAEIKMLREEIDAVRIILAEQFFRPLYQRMRRGAGRSPGFKDKDIVLPTFDNNSLRDDAIWLGAMADLYSRGVLSAETLSEVFGLNFEYQAEQKKKEHEELGNTSTGEPGTPMNNSPMRPLYEPSQGNLNPVRDKGGNEAAAGSEPDGSPRGPRKSGS